MTQVKKSKKYVYDYPENRVLGRDLSFEDRTEIARRLNLSYHYVYSIFIEGDRTNKAAVQLAKILIEKKRKLNQEIDEAIMEADVIRLRNKLETISEKPNV